MPPRRINELIQPTRATAAVVGFHTVARFPGDNALANLFVLRDEAVTRPSGRSDDKGSSKNQ